MINPEQAWCIQVSITELCWPKAADGSLTSCSNCTRGIAHIRKRHIMSLDEISRAVDVLATFPRESAACPQGRRKVVGCFGAETLFHPQFPEVVDIFTAAVPDVWNRGLWTSLDWKTYEHPKYGPARPHVERLIGTRPSGSVWERERSRYGSGGYLNWNMHAESQKCVHSPVLVAISETIKDEQRRYELISQCPYQRDWSPLIGPDADGEVKFFFCEVAQTQSRLFGLNVGIPLSADCWKGEIQFEPDAAGVLRPQGKFAKQIESCCNRCGGATPLPGRRDLEFRDDISPLNVIDLGWRNSPQIKRGEHVEIDTEEYDEAEFAGGWNPLKYIRGKA